MRKNGFLTYEFTHPGRINEDGEPISDFVEWSQPIPCSIKTNSDNRLGKYEDGVFRQASFVVLTETIVFPEDIKRVHLTRLNEDLGEYGIISMEALLTVGRIKILV